jgi:putative ABC transport system permease protein
MISAIWQDLIFGARLMRRRPGLSLTAAGVLALGIGVNTALFSAVNALFFTPLPVADPHQLFYVYQRSPEGRTFAPRMGAEELELLRAQTGDVAEYAFHADAPATLTVGEETERISGETVSGNYFALLGTATAQGRPLGTQDDDVTAPPAIVISYALWESRFQSDPAAVGRSVRLNDRAVTTVGVAPRGFFGARDRLTPSDYWMTAAQAAPDGRWRGAPIGRMRRPGSFDELAVRFRALSPRLAELNLQRLEQGAAAAGGRVAGPFVASLRQAAFIVRKAADVQMPLEPDLRLVPPALLGGLAAVVTLVLLIATANIAGLLLARGVTRTREVAVRRALGAGPGRLARQLIAENALLSAISGMAGLGLGVMLIALFRASAPVRYAIEVGVDVRVLLFVAVVSGLTGMLAALAPARQAARVDVLQALGGGTNVAPGRRRLRHAVVIPQVALSLVLLAVAAVQTRGLLMLETADRGYRAESVTAFNIGRPVPTTLDAETARAWRMRVPSIAKDIGVRLEGLTEVGAFAFTSRLPLTADQSGYRVMTEAGLAAGAAGSATAPQMPWLPVTPGYFETLEIGLSGRAFDTRDSSTSAKVAVLSRAAARSLWPDGQAIGRRITFMQGARPGPWIEVIGVANDVKPVLDAERDSPLVYVPLEQSPIIGMAASVLIVRAAGDARTLVQSVKRAVVDAEPLLEVWRVRTLSSLVDETLYLRRLAATVLAGAGFVGLALACIGLYGVVSYSVAQRLREIGIRTTLGAGRRDILLLVLREGAGVTLVGSALGILIAALGISWASRVVPGLPAPDLAIFLAVAAALSLVVIAACLVPAHRASRVDPARVLRGL